MDVKLPVIRLSTQLASGAKTIATEGGVTPKAQQLSSSTKNASFVAAALSGFKKKGAQGGTEEPLAGIPSASSDKQSEEGSTSQDDQKKRIKNPQQHKTKGLRRKAQKFDPNKQELLNHLSRMVPDRRLKNAGQLKHWLAKRY